MKVPREFNSILREKFGKLPRKLDWDVILQLLVPEPHSISLNTGLTKTTLKYYEGTKLLHEWRWKNAEVFDVGLGEWKWDIILTPILCATNKSQ